MTEGSAIVCGVPRCFSPRGITAGARRSRKVSGGEFALGTVEGHLALHGAHEAVEPQHRGWQMQCSSPYFCAPFLPLGRVNGVDFSHDGQEDRGLVC